MTVFSSNLTTYPITPLTTSLPTYPSQGNQCKVIPFPRSATTPKRVSPAIQRRGMKQEVYPIKEPAYIEAMQRYFLTEYREATTWSSKLNALRDWFWFVLGINIGYRGGDISALKWRDLVDENYKPLDSAYHYVQEEKTGKHRQLIFNADCRKMIQFYLDHLCYTPSLDDYVFPSNKGGHLEVRSYLTKLKKAAAAVGIPYNVGTHSLRKTFGYRYFKSTGDLATLQRIFNHSDSLVTLRYIGIDAELLQAAYEQVNGTALPEDTLNDLMGWPGK